MTDCGHRVDEAHRTAGALACMRALACARPARRVGLWLGSLIIVAGYGGLYACASGLVTATFPRVILFALLAGNSSPFWDTTCLVTCVRNFPRDRGTIVGIIKAFIGLSASIHSTIFTTFFAPDVRTGRRAGGLLLRAVPPLSPVHGPCCCLFAPLGAPHPPSLPARAAAQGCTFDAPCMRCAGFPVCAALCCAAPRPPLPHHLSCAPEPYGLETLLLPLRPLPARPLPPLPPPPPPSPQAIKFLLFLALVPSAVTLAISLFINLVPEAYHESTLEEQQRQEALLDQVAPGKGWGGGAPGRD